MLQQLSILRILLQKLVSTALDGTVAPVLVLLPEMSRHRISDSSIFSEDVHELAFHGVHGRLRIMMAVLDVSAEREIASGSLVDEPGRVKIPRIVHNFLRVELAPCLIERNPYHDALESFQGIYDLCPLLVIIVLPFLGNHAVRTAEEAVS